MIRLLLYRAWYGLMVLSIGMMLFLGVLGAFWLVYWLAFALWGPG